MSRHAFLKSAIQGCAAAGLLGLACAALSAQTPTATRRLQLSGFAMASGTYTGLATNQQAAFQGGRNIAFTAGGDLGFFSPGRYSLAVEVRGSYPLLSGIVDGEKSILGGLRFSREPVEEAASSSVRPYVDVLFGRGQMNYQNGGYPTQTLLFYQANSNILDGGGGVEFDVTRSFAFKIDAQAQRWKTPILPGTSVWSKQGSIGVAYRFGAGGYPH